jgi:hypothetical protein
VLRIVSQQPPSECDQLGHPPVGDPVVDRPVLPAALDEAAPAQAAEVVGDLWLWLVQQVDELADGALALGQGLEDANAGRIPEAAEVLGRKGLKWRKQDTTGESLRDRSASGSAAGNARKSRRGPSLDLLGALLARPRVDGRGDRAGSHARPGRRRRAAVGAAPARAHSRHGPDRPPRQPGRLIPLFSLPATAGASFLFYGASMLVAAARRGGGCQVTAISNALLKRDDQVGCPLFAPLDIAEVRLRGDAPRPD